MTTPRWMLAAGLLLAGGAAAYGLVQVPILQDAPKPKVERITDADEDLLPVESKGTRQDDLLPVESKGKPKDELLDLFADDDTQDAAERKRRLAAKAGKHASPGINSGFSFDLAIGYHALVPEAGLVQSYYLVDSRHGHVGMDRGAIESMANAQATGEGATVDFQVLTSTADHYTYMTTSEMGPVAMSVRSGESPIGRDFEAFAAGDWFEDSFKPTGNVRDIGRNLSNAPYRSVEYAGVDPESGTPLKVWLATPDFDVGFYAVSYMGVGIVPLPKAGVQKLVTRTEGAGATFELSYVMRKPQTFDGARYKDMSQMMEAYSRGAANMTPQPETQP